MSIALTPPEPSLTFVPPPAGFVPPERVTAARRLTERIPALYPLAVRAHQLRQHLRWRTDDRVYARTHATDPLEHRVKQHNSLLLRELSADEMRLQHNKVINLRLASAETDGILIRPGESFSFNRTVGNCTRARGFVEGMRLTNGRAIAGVGGGICQLANLIHWMVLHSPLTVTARSEHSFDPFPPDKGRVLPWGGSAARSCGTTWTWSSVMTPTRPSGWRPGSVSATWRVR